MIGSQLIFFKEWRERIAQSHSCLKKDKSERAKIKRLKERIPNPVLWFQIWHFICWFQNRLFAWMVLDPTFCFDCSGSDFSFWWFHFQLFSDEGFVSNFSFWWFSFQLFVLMVLDPTFCLDGSVSNFSFWLFRIRLNYFFRIIFFVLINLDSDPKT